ncbi:MAG TPA: chemotaxis protein CheA [Pyrinomonadaceae bacterium]|nr:chemotaxis protein CheA [Pyrinomonadaceae bacterium]
MDKPTRDNAGEFFDQFLDDYYAECDEHLVSIRRALVTLEDEVDTGAVDRALLDNLFRSFHTLKGISGMVGLGAAEQLAHHLESYLRELREGTAILSQPGFEALAAGVSLLENVINARRRDQPIPPIDEIADRLRAHAQSVSSIASIPPTSPAKQEMPQPDAVTMRWRAEFTPTAELAARGVNVNSVRTRLQEIGELIQAKPIVKSAGEIAFHFIVATDVDQSVLKSLEADGLVFEAVPNETVPNVKGNQPVPTIAPASVVRVDLDRLDELMRIIGDLVISRTRLEDQLTELKRATPATVWRPLQETSLRIGRQLKYLRESFMRVRMVQIGEIFERMTFVVRDLARESGKKIIVQLSGGETEIDKFLVERIMDPLMHLVRNAVSHGLESVGEREAQGKRSEGLLSLSAMTAGEKIIIKIADDGRGIDRELVLQRATARGLSYGASAIDDKALLELICSPGFSTRDEADRESGRGVGMDVVKRAIEDLGGYISLATNIGEGTIFTIELPLTLAIAEALIVSVNGQKFAVPQSAVREVMEVESASTKVLENNEIISYRGRVLPLLRLARVFDMDHQRGPRFHVLVLGEESNAVGLAVDRILSQQEIVVRAIKDPLAQTKGIAGATELGDQRVVLILDISALREFALQSRH